MRYLLTLATAFLLGVPVIAQAETLLVSAAASLNHAFKEIAAAFESRHTGVTVQLNFAASGSLLQQIVQGAPVDVLASADQITMDRAQEQHLIDVGTRRDFVSNALVVIAPSSADTAARSEPNLAALEQATYKRIALGRPETVPAGLYAQHALEKAGLWAALKPRYIYADNVRQVLDYVRRGEVDAGFVYASDAAMAGDAVQVILESVNIEPVRYPVAVMRESQHAPLAAQFLAFLTEQGSREILKRHGFSTAQ